MPGTAKSRLSGQASHVLQVGVRQDNERVLGPALALGTFAVGRSPTVDIFGHWCRAHKADRPHIGVVEKSINRLFRAVDQVDDTVRQASLLNDLEDLLRRHGRLFRGFQDKGVAAGDGVGQEPQGDHPRKIKGCDGRDDADRLTNQHFVDATGDVLAVGALHQDGDTTSDLHVLNAASQFAHRLRVRLTAFVGDRARQIVQVLFEHVLQLKQVLHALYSGSLSPLPKSVGSSPHGGVYLSSRGQRESGDHLRCGRVHDVKVFPGTGAAPGSVNVVEQLLGHNCSLYFSEREERSLFSILLTGC